MAEGALPPDKGALQALAPPTTTDQETGAGSPVAAALVNIAEEYPCIIVSTDRAADCPTFVANIYNRDPKKWGNILPWEFPQNATREIEEKFIRRWFTAEQIHMQGGAKGNGEGYRFLKGAWYGCALWNWEQRIPMLARWVLAEPKYRELIDDQDMEKYILREDANERTLFMEEELRLYPQKIAMWAFKYIQNVIKERIALRSNTPPPTEEQVRSSGQETIPGSCEAVASSCERGQSREGTPTVLNSSRPVQQESVTRPPMQDISTTPTPQPVHLRTGTEPFPPFQDMPVQLPQAATRGGRGYERRGSFRRGFDAGPRHFDGHFNPRYAGHAPVWLPENPFGSQQPPGFTPPLSSPYDSTIGSIVPPQHYYNDGRIPSATFPSTGNSSQHATTGPVSGHSMPPSHPYGQVYTQVNAPQPSWQQPASRRLPFQADVTQGQVYPDSNRPNPFVDRTNHQHHTANVDGVDYHMAYGPPTEIHEQRHWRGRRGSKVSRGDSFRAPFEGRGGRSGGRAGRNTGSSSVHNPESGRRQTKGFENVIPAFSNQPSSSDPHYAHNQTTIGRDFVLPRGSIGDDQNPAHDPTTSPQCGPDWVGDDATHVKKLMVFTQGREFSEDELSDIFGGGGLITRISLARPSPGYKMATIMFHSHIGVRNGLMKSGLVVHGTEIRVEVAREYWKPGHKTLSRASFTQNRTQFGQSRSGNADSKPSNRANHGSSFPPQVNENTSGVIALSDQEMLEHRNEIGRSTNVDTVMSGKSTAKGVGRKKNNGGRRKGKNSLVDIAGPGTEAASDVSTGSKAKTASGNSKQVTTNAPMESSKPIGDVQPQGIIDRVQPASSHQINTECSPKPSIAFEKQSASDENTITDKDEVGTAPAAAIKVDLRPGDDSSIGSSSYKAAEMEEAPATKLDASHQSDEIIIDPKPAPGHTIPLEHQLPRDSEGVPTPVPVRLPPSGSGTEVPAAASLNFQTEENSAPTKQNATATPSNTSTAVTEKVVLPLSASTPEPQVVQDIDSATQSQRSTSGGTDKNEFHTAPNTPAVLREQQAAFAGKDKPSVEASKKSAKAKGPAQTDAINPIFSKKQKTSTKKKNKKGGSVNRKPTALSLSLEHPEEPHTPSEKTASMGEVHTQSAQDELSIKSSEASDFAAAKSAKTKGKERATSPKFEAVPTMEGLGTALDPPQISPKRGFFKQVTGFLNFSGRPRSESAAQSQGDTANEDNVAISMPSMPETSTTSKEPVHNSVQLTEGEQKPTDEALGGDQGDEANALRISGIDTLEKGSQKKKKSKKPKKKNKSTNPTENNSNVPSSEANEMSVTTARPQTAELSPTPMGTTDKSLGKPAAGHKLDKIIDASMRTTAAGNRNVSEGQDQTIPRSSHNPPIYVIACPREHQNLYDRTSPKQTPRYGAGETTDLHLGAPTFDSEPPENTEAILTSLEKFKELRRAELLYQRATAQSSILEPSAKKNLHIESLDDTVEGTGNSDGSTETSASLIESLLAPPGVDVSSTAPIFFSSKEDALCARRIFENSEDSPFWRVFSGGDVTVAFQPRGWTVLFEPANNGASRFLLASAFDFVTESEQSSNSDDQSLSPSESMLAPLDDNEGTLTVFASKRAAIEYQVHFAQSAEYKLLGEGIMKPYNASADGDAWQVIYTPGNGGPQRLLKASE